MITLEILCAVCPALPGTVAGSYLQHLNQACNEFAITTKQRAAAFCAQLAHESSQLRAWVEHSDGEQYEGRASLGNTEPGDGPRFKGRGPIQLTGRSNYAAAGRALGVDLVDSPELAATPAVGFRVAGWYWRSHGCNQLADAGDFDAITKRINGGMNGADRRRAFYLRALHAFGLDATQPQTLPPERPGDWAPWTPPDFTPR